MSERCADVSRAVGESLAATATSAERWLLVEVRGPWSRDVGGSDALPEAARAAVDAWLARTSGSRLLFIRRPGQTGGGSLAFVVHAGEVEGSVRRFRLGDLGELAELDLDTGGEPVDTRLVLVCGHGSRDACCALRGNAVFGTLAPGLGEQELWVSSHHGGHRFAANVLVLPAGIHLGRLDADNARRIVASALAGKIELENYRGRTCYPAPVQAAERAVRESVGLTGLGDVRLLAADGGVVRFLGMDGALHSVEVTETKGPSVPVSCGTAPEPQTAYEASLV